MRMCMGADLWNYSEERREKRYCVNTALLWDLIGQDILSLRWSVRERV